MGCRALAFCSPGQKCRETVMCDVLQRPLPRICTTMVIHMKRIAAFEDRDPLSLSYAEGQDHCFAAFLAIAADLCVKGSRPIW